MQTEPVQPLLHLMQESVNRFQRIIKQLTDVSKLQKEHGLLTQELELARIVHDVRLDLGPLLQESGARLDVDVAAVPTVLFLGENLRSVVFNLLNNVLKYRDPARPLPVRLRGRPEWRMQADA